MWRGKRSADSEEEEEEEIYSSMFNIQYMDGLAYSSENIALR